MKKENDLLAAYFTISGDVHPFGETEISTFDFKHRVEAAANAGYKGIGLVHSDLMKTASVIGFKEMKRILDSNGIKKVEFEFLTEWYRLGKERVESDKIRKDLLNAADILNPVNIKAGPSIGIDESNNNVPLMIEEFEKLSEQAKEHGTNIALEIMPFGNIRTVEMALKIVEGANHSNGGLLLDIWHINRGNISYEEIAEIPVEFIKSIELNDADRYPLKELWLDTIHKRRLCGDGVLDIRGFITAIQKTGYKGHWGVEILSEKLRKLSLEEMAQKSFDTTIAYF